MKKKIRRCDRKEITREAEVLKYLREVRKLSMRDVGKIINRSGGIINHIENGRVDLRPEFIMKLLDIYGVNYSNFLDLCKGETETPEQVRSDCVRIIKKIPHDKLKAIKTILASFQQI
jgi:transcriptional regulator with XRE-family HTH domain